MVYLTERLLKEKAKGVSLHHIKKLNFWGHSLDDISILTAQCPNVEVLSLSVNDISSLERFGALPNLRELYLRKNRIRDPHQTRYLSSARNLRFLWLLENECADHPNYRQIVIANCPHLTKLDDQDVTSMERERAVQSLQELAVASAPRTSPPQPPSSQSIESPVPVPAAVPSSNPQRPSARTPTPKETPTPPLAVPQIQAQSVPDRPMEPYQAQQGQGHRQHRENPNILPFSNEAISNSTPNPNVLRGNVHQFASADFPSNRGRTKVHSDYIPKEQQHLQRPRVQRPTRTESIHRNDRDCSGASGNTDSAMEYSFYSHNSKADLPQSTKENLLMAIFALLNELDSDGLVVVRKQLEKLSNNH